MKIIFLDIDGVLNSAMGKDPYFSDMEEKKLILLKSLIDESHSAGVVITSDRRYSSIDMSDKKKAFDRFDIKVVGELRRPNIDDYDDNRGKQIKDYLIENPHIDSFVILDDNDDGISPLFKDNFILINRFFGLDEEVLLKAKKILSFSN